ncbi:hypothetical protein [Methylovulum psychrotolerans]|uniref:hypothetical protein n=1 Tax=Methylovulum psychrotolerans TaxID=1704499 RepID=UPI0012F86AFE|nr:hypothetical protein [Methylovulum psychrotolerans]
MAVYFQIGEFEVTAFCAVLPQVGGVFCTCVEAIGDQFGDQTVIKLQRQVERLGLAYRAKGAE